MSQLAQRDWVPDLCEKRVQELAGWTSSASSDAVDGRIADLVDENRQIHERDCFNLNPATNVMNPRAEAILAAGIGSRPSLG